MGAEPTPGEIHAQLDMFLSPLSLAPGRSGISHETRALGPRFAAGQQDGQ